MRFVQREVFLAGGSSKKVVGLFIDDDTYNMFCRQEQGVMQIVYRSEVRQELFGYPVDRIHSKRHIVIVEFNDGTAKIIYPYLGAYTHA